jgi:hypothetical protein
MDPEQAPLHCEHRGEPVWPSDPMVVLMSEDAKTGEPLDIPGKVIHKDCEVAWREAQREPDTA